MDIINKTKIHFLEVFRKKENPPYIYLPRHVFETEKWVERIIQKYPEANREVVLLSVWLHDIGQIIGEDIDHAVNSENETRLFLPKIEISPERIGGVTHCVRAHKCKDIQPDTLEAKILAVANAVSHMTDFYYITMISRLSKETALNKLKRDCQIIKFLPSVEREIKPFCDAWKELLNIYPD